MKKQFSYCFIKYVHSLRLSESINVGMIFLFPDQSRVAAKFPEKLKGLDCLYKDFDETIVKEYFKIINHKLSEFDGIEKIFKERFSQQTLTDYLYNDIIVDDQSAIQISEVKTGVLYSSDTDKIIEDIFSSYFSYYKGFALKEKALVLEENSQAADASGDDSIVQLFEQYLSRRKFDVLEKMERRIPVHSVNSETSIVFDYRLDNANAQNLIKAISFDLKTKRAIEQKALNFTGRIHVLDVERAFDKRTRIDLIVASPKNIRFERSYLSAVNILKNSSDRTRIVSEGELASYSDEVYRLLS